VRYGTRRKIKKMGQEKIKEWRKAKKEKLSRTQRKAFKTTVAQYAEEWLGRMMELKDTEATLDPETFAKKVNDLYEEIAVFAKETAAQFSKGLVLKFKLENMILDYIETQIKEKL